MNPASLSRRAKLLLSFAIVYLVWGSSYLVTKLGVMALPPFLFGAVRFITGGLLLFTIASLLRRQRGESIARPTGREWRHIAVVGLCVVFISNSASAWGLQYVPSYQAALLSVSSSFWIPVLGLLGARAEPISPRSALGLLIGIGGTVLIALPASVGAETTAPSALWPTLSILVGCLGWSAGTIYLRNVDTSLDVMSFTALHMLCGGLMMLLLALLFGDTHRWQWDFQGLAALGYMIVFSSCIAYTAFAWLSVNVTPAQLATYGFVNPVIAILLGWWVLDEQLGALRIVGTLIVLGGLLLIHSSQMRSAPATSAPGGTT